MLAPTTSGVETPRSCQTVSSRDFGTCSTTELSSIWLSGRCPRALRARGACPGILAGAGQASTANRLPGHPRDRYLDQLPAGKVDDSPCLPHFGVTDRARSLRRQGDRPVEQAMSKGRTSVATACTQQAFPPSLAEPRRPALGRAVKRRCPGLLACSKWLGRQDSRALSGHSSPHRTDILTYQQDVRRSGPFRIQEDCRRHRNSG